MENITAKIEKKTRKVFLSKSVIGNDGENLQEKLVFSFDSFVNGTARLELNRNNTQSYIMLTKVDNTYELPIKSLITKVGKLDLQLVITEGTNENEIPIFKSNVFFVIVNPSINAEIEEPEEYPQWIDVANTKLNEIDEALDDLQDKVDSGYFKGEKGDPGQNATINGINTLNITAGENITLNQSGNNLEISATGGSGGTSDYNDLEGKPKINNVELIGNKTTSDLGIIIPDISNLQEKITNVNKLEASLVDDSLSTNKFVTSAEKTTWNAKYDKPSTGIPKTDLAQAVQDILDDVSNKEDTTNKVTTIDNTSTDTQYASAKAIYDLVSSGGSDIELKDINQTLYGSPFDFANKYGIYTANPQQPKNTFYYKSKLNGSNVEYVSAKYLIIFVWKKIEEITETTPFATMLCAKDGILGNLGFQYNPTTDVISQTFFQTTNMQVLTDLAQSISGTKTFANTPSIKTYSAPTQNTQLVAKKYVDDSIASAITTTLNGSY